MQTTAAGVVKAEPKKEEPVAEEKKVVEKEEKAQMPATAVFEASSRVMSDKEKEVMMNRVQEAKRRLGMQDDGYSSPSVRDPFQPVSSYRPAASYGSSATGSSPSSDQSDVDRIFAELTSKYGLQSSGSAPTRPSAVPNSYNPPAMPSYGSSYPDSTAPPAAAAKGYALPLPTTATPPSMLTRSSRLLHGHLVHSTRQGPHPGVQQVHVADALGGLLGVHSLGDRDAAGGVDPSSPNSPPVPKAAPRLGSLRRNPWRLRSPRRNPWRLRSPLPLLPCRRLPRRSRPVTGWTCPRLALRRSRTWISGVFLAVRPRWCRRVRSWVSRRSRRRPRRLVRVVLEESRSSTPRETAKPPASGSAANEQILSEMLEEGTVIKRKKPKDESK